MSSFYDKAVGGLPQGHSSYFESPHGRLDPSLFDGTRLRPEVRARLLAMLEDGLQSALNMQGMDSWLTAWLAGSGITYQWEGGEGDLDVLFGVDMPQFALANPQYQGISEAATADWVNTKLKEVVWPETSHTRFGQRTYEVTFFWNPGTDATITRIKPYAAYDLYHDTWTVRPPELPEDPAKLYPREWYEAADRDTRLAGQIARGAARHSSVLATVDPSSAPGRNASTALERVRAAAKELFDDIHLGRREAFGDQGHGYSDWHNFRWQHAKATGVVTALRALTEEARAADEARETELYGGPIEGPDKILMRDMLRYRPGQ